MKKETIIRKATSGDLCAILQCVEQSFEKYIDRIGKKPAPMLKDYQDFIARDLVFVVECEDCVAGFIVLIDMPDHLLLDTVAVSPAFQGKSLGKKLLQFAETLAAEKGKDEIKLCTNEKMHENLAIYTRAGYVEYERGVEKGYNRVFFKKKLGTFS